MCPKICIHIHTYTVYIYICSMNNTYVHTVPTYVRMYAYMYVQIYIRTNACIIGMCEVANIKSYIVASGQ